MQRERVALVFQNDARAGLGNCSKPALHIGVEQRQPGRHGILSGGNAKLCPMPADRGQLQGRENQIKLGDRPAADEGHGSARAL